MYDSNALKNVIGKKQFKENVMKLNLPLTVQDHRVMSRIADPKQTGRIDLTKFIERFETVDLRKMRLNKVLDIVATSFFVSNFSMKKAFEQFDINGDGKISKAEFRGVFASLKLNLRMSEIDEVFKMIATDKSGELTIS
jgi:Ca2+-binding EF-hand superfamily protein